MSEKLKLPVFKDHIPRPRIEKLLKRSLEQTGTVLVTGRAATGKTALAATFAQKYDRKDWYRIEAADSDWKVFSQYFFSGHERDDIFDQNIARSVEKMLGDTERISIKKRLIVLDDIHNVFDTRWFSEFFLTLVHSISPNTHVICLSRSLPDLPLWRLRSKQNLSVIEERAIAFDRAEVAEFCALSDIAGPDVDRIYAESFGRIGKLKIIMGKGMQVC